MMKKDINQNDVEKVLDKPRIAWSKPVLIDLNISQTAGVKARYQADEVAVFSDKAPTEEWGPS